MHRFVACLRVLHVHPFAYPNPALILQKIVLSAVTTFLLNLPRVPLPAAASVFGAALVAAQRHLGSPDERPAQATFPNLTIHSSIHVHASSVV